eukprot:TRINITY_DN2164_c0_g1_i4.p1 TRINITY_DN2164_c0_g1~~TRINITY_DN2164_c0_g1_i4.p1  ORF type:complete len:203 (+),score=51.34 TRINITY_DN2164_c0_g1_i4:1456-2064(+)
MYFTALAGGMIAEEVTQGVPIAADVACTNLSVGQMVVSLFMTPTFHLQCTTDVVGVELAGAFKNVLAIGAGLFDGLGLSISSKSAFVSMAACEFRGLAVAMGADPHTYGLGTHAWLGDLLTTCFGSSRNRLLGEMIGKGLSPGEALQKLHEERKIAEGYVTTKAFCDIGKNLRIEMPILENLTKILFFGAPVRETVYSCFRK